MALRIDGAVIDSLGLPSLTNRVRGWRTIQFGRIPLRQPATEGKLSPVHLRKHVAFMDLVNSNHQRNEQGRLPAKGIGEIRLERNPCTSTTTELLSCRSRRGPLWMAKGWACHKERSTF
jgi:hypothetical protein